MILMDNDKDHESVKIMLTYMPQEEFPHEPYPQSWYFHITVFQWQDDTARNIAEFEWVELHRAWPTKREAYQAALEKLAELYAMTELPESQV